MRKSYRQGRLSEEIKKIISEMLYKDLKDPRLSGFVSIAEVKAVKDGSFATVYVSVLGNTYSQESDSPSAAEIKERQDVIDAFNSAKGLIRREIGTRLKLRHSPELVFKIDTVEEYGRKIDSIINGLGIQNDEE
jgi:ribosome-binding factor A